MHNNNVDYLLQKNNNNLDIIRIACASAVIIGHSYKMNPQVGHEDLIRLFTGFTYSSALAVKIFFFISGMLVTDSLLKRKSIPVFFVSRFFRIIPGLLFLLIITSFIVGPAVTTLHLSDYFHHTDIYKYIYTNISFRTNYLLPGVFETNPWKLFVNAALWTLRIEVKCYMLLLLMFFFIGTRKILYNIIIAAVFVDAIFNLHYIGVGDSTELSLLPFSFALGMLMAVNKDIIVINYITLLVSVVITAALWHTPVNQIMFIVSACILVVQLCKNEYVKKIKIKHDISYGIYLWGFIVQQTIYYFVGQQNLYLYMLECLLVSVACGYISYILVEHRFIEFGKKINRKIKGQQAGLINLFVKSRA